MPDDMHVYRYIRQRLQPFACQYRRYSGHALVLELCSPGLDTALGLLKLIVLVQGQATEVAIV